MTDYNRERGSSIARTHRSAQKKTPWTDITLVVLEPDGPNNNKTILIILWGKNRRGKKTQTNPPKTKTKNKCHISRTRHKATRHANSRLQTMLN